MLGPSDLFQYTLYLFKISITEHSVINNPLCVGVSQPTYYLKYICQKTEMNDHPASIGFSVIEITIASAAGFIYRNYRYKYVGTEINQC